MKNYNLDRILAPAFKLFLTYNYEKVSTSLLEEATGLTRGAIFYKLRTKEDIFKAVIDKYIIDIQSNDIMADGLFEFIEKFIEKVETRMKGILALNIMNMHRAYFGLIYQALHYYPGFDEKITLLFNKDLEMWETIIQTAKNKGEIKMCYDTKELAQKFRYTYSGLSFERSFLHGLDIEELRTLYYSYYNEIKHEK